MQITASLSAGVNVVSLLSLNFQGRIVAWFDPGTTSGSFYFYGSVDSTTDSDSQNVQPLGNVTVSPGTNEPQLIALNSLAGFPYLVVLSPGTATLLVSGGSVSVTPSLASVETPSDDAFSAVADISAFDPNIPVTVMCSKELGASNGFLVYGSESAEASGLNGCVLLGTITGGYGSDGTADHLAYISVLGWPYLIFYRRSDVPYTGTTAGTIKAAGVLPGGLGVPIDVNPTPNTIAERGNEGQIAASFFWGGAGNQTVIEGDTRGIRIDAQSSDCDIAGDNLTIECMSTFVVAANRTVNLAASADAAALAQLTATATDPEGTADVVITAAGANALVDIGSDGEVDINASGGSVSISARDGVDLGPLIAGDGRSGTVRFRGLAAASVPAPPAGSAYEFFDGTSGKMGCKTSDNVFHPYY
jgi:hypothetical protein